MYMTTPEQPRWLLRAAGACLLAAAVVFFALSFTSEGEAPRPPAGRPAGNLAVVWWNVENLFDADDDPSNPGDDEYTPASWRRWTDELYQLKLQRLAEVLADLDGDIVCLAEVENRRVVEDLADMLQSRFGKPYPFITHRDSGDERGIDVAMLSRYEPDRCEWQSPVPGQRDVLLAEFSPDGRKLTVIANHWKSRWDGAAKSDPIRRREAAAVGARVDRVLAKDPLAAILVTGDFNDDMDGPAVAGELRSSTNRAAVLSGAARLYCPQGELPAAQRGTIYYRAGKVWNTFDSACVSRSMVNGGSPGAAWRLAPGGFMVYRAERLLTTDGYPRSFRRLKNRETGRWEYQTGYSDHLPIRVALTRP